MCILVLRLGQTKGFPAKYSLNPPRRLTAGRSDGWANSRPSRAGLIGFGTAEESLDLETPLSYQNALAKGLQQV